MGEAHDLNEATEHMGESRSVFDTQVAVTMAILAVLLGADGLFGHRAHTDEVLNQARASDQWAFYQAKTIRRSLYEVGATLARLSPAQPEVARVSAELAATQHRYETEAKAIEEQAREFERERDSEALQANRFDLAEVFLEVGIVACSLALLSKRRSYWIGSFVLAAIGIAIALSVVAIK